MTKHSPRIYTYKITFEEVPYYYYGVHKEKKFGEYYMGSPITHKWCWDFYTPKKQILEIFHYTDEDYIKAQEVEKRLIKPFYNIDKWCLNENVGGLFSLETHSKAGKRAYELKLGVHSRSKEQIIEDGRKGGQSNGENKTGFCGRSREQIIEDGRKGGKISGKRNKENKIGICGLSREQRSEAGKIGGKRGSIEDKIKAGKIVSSQKWVCLETGFTTNAGNLTKYQKARGIDTSKRIRVS